MLIDLYIRRFNPLPSRTQGELLERLHRILVGGPVNFPQILTAFTAVSFKDSTTRPMLLSIAEFADHVMQGYTLPRLYGEYYDHPAQCLAQAIQANFHYLYLLTIGEWLFGPQSEIGYDVEYFEEITLALYNRLYAHVAAKQANGETVTLLELHALLRQELHAEVYSGAIISDTAKSLS